MKYESFQYQQKEKEVVKNMEKQIFISNEKNFTWRHNFETFMVFGNKIERVI
jgi:hypothetical protein